MKVSLRKSPRQATARQGRALVECIVSIFLLAIVSLASAAATNGTLAIADDSTLIARAQALAVTRVEDALTAPCAFSASGSDQLPRVNLLWQRSGALSSATVHLDVTLDRTALAQTVMPAMQLSLEGGGVCP